MATWVNALVHDNGLNHIRNNANSLRLISSYAVGATYATVVANTLATAACINTDFTLSDGGPTGSRRVVGPTGKTATASATAGGTPDLHIAFIDTVNSQVLWVTDETTNQPITSGNTVTFPNGLVYTTLQPTAA